MKLAVATLSVSREAGGLFESVRFSSHALRENGVDVCVVALRDDFTRKDLPNWDPLRAEVVEFSGPRQLLFAPGFRRKLSAIEPDVMHTHGLWQPSSYAVLRHHRKSGVPYVVSPRGMLDPWALANSGWKKRLAGAVFENAHLREAACLHALCESEAVAMRSYGLRNPIAVVPNGVALPIEKPDGFQCSVFSVQPGHGEPKTLLFLGRLHPKKGLPGALRAWSRVTKEGRTGWRFVIAGWDQGGHEADLKRLCAELGVRFAEISANELTQNRQPSTENSVVFAGPAFGEVKGKLLGMADAFILPSLSEGLPMSVLEAWAYGLPVLMTEECHLPEGFAAGAAVRVGPDGASDEWRVTSDGGEVRCGGVLAHGGCGVTRGMRGLMAMTDEGRVMMGRRGRELVEERFTWPKVAGQMRAVYEWVLGTGAKPECVMER